MKRRKAAGLDKLTVEHVVYGHPVSAVILAKLFNLIMFDGHVPYGFRLSYAVPLPKKDNACKRNIIDNYRAISISSVLSKMFEHCVLTRYTKYVETSPNQFGFKKGSSCGHAIIYSVKKSLNIMCLEPLEGQRGD